MRFIEKHKLNEMFEGEAADIGFIVQGGLYNALIQALQALGLADAFGETKMPIYVLNVTYPLIESEVLRFCEGKRAVLMVEEGQPEFIEQGLHTILARAGARPPGSPGRQGHAAAGRRIYRQRHQGGRGALSQSLQAGPSPQELERPADVAARRAAQASHPMSARASLSFCTGCPERPVFSAIKLAARELGDFHVSCDTGCHLFSALPPLNPGNTTMGYGLGEASASALTPNGWKPAISVLGDGGFWHNGLLSSIGNAVFNKNGNVHIIVDNGYSAARGGQETLSSAADKAPRSAGRQIEETLRAIGVRWVWTMPDTYDVKRMRAALKEAIATPGSGPKVIVARSECMLTRHRREGPLTAARLERGSRVVRQKFGNDPALCTGDHTCIRLSGCPSLTIAPNPDPLNLEPITKVSRSCTGCGLCGEIAHAAVLCPSYFRASIIHNPSMGDRLRAWLRTLVIAYFQRRLERPAFSLAGAPR